MPRAKMNPNLEVKSPGSRTPSNKIMKSNKRKVLKSHSEEINYSGASPGGERAH